MKNENIRLDARIHDMIDDAAFLARLANGHEFVAYAAGPEKAAARTLKPGDEVVVDMSPFDMGQGRILERKNNES